MRQKKKGADGKVDAHSGSSRNYDDSQKVSKQEAEQVGRWLVGLVYEQCRKGNPDPAALEVDRELIPTEGPRRIFERIQALVAAGEPVEAAAIAGTFSEAERRDLQPLSLIERLRDEAEQHATTSAPLIRQLRAHQREQRESAFIRSLRQIRSSEDARAALAQYDEEAPAKPRPSLLVAADLVTEPDEVIQWTVDGLLPAGGLSLLVAKPKVGKSTMARHLAVAVASGEPFLGRQTVAGPVLYLALEEKKSHIRSHLRRLGVDADTRTLHLHIGPLPPGDPIRWLKDRINETGATLVVIDTLGRFVQARDLNDYAEAVRLSRPLIEMAHGTGAHILCLHHAGKGDLRTGIDAGIGSTAWAGSVDTHLSMKRNQTGTRTLETIQRTGDDMAETQVILDRDTGRVKLGVPAEVAKLADARTVILDTVRAGKQQAKAEILSTVGGDKAVASRALYALYNEGELDRVGSGTKGDPYLYNVRQATKPPKPPKPASADGGLPALVACRLSHCPEDDDPELGEEEDCCGDPELAEARACHACGSEEFWEQAGGLMVCSRCHPRPRVDPRAQQVGGPGDAQHSGKL
jgi:hypothetical protein